MVFHIFKTLHIFGTYVDSWSMCQKLWFGNPWWSCNEGSNGRFSTIHYGIETYTLLCYLTLTWLMMVVVIIITYHTIRRLQIANYGVNITSINHFSIRSLLSNGNHLVLDTGANWQVRLTTHPFQAITPNMHAPNP